MKKRIIAGICFIFLFCNVVYATDYLNEQELIRIGYLTDYGVIQSVHTPDSEGYGYEYFEELSKYTGHQYEYVECDWAEGIQMLEDGELDLFGPLEKTEERLEVFGYTGNCFGYEEVLLVSPRDADILYDDFDKINDSTISILEGSTFGAHLEQYLLQNNISAEVVTYADLDADRGEYDLSVESSLFSTNDFQTVSKLGVYPFYFATQKENTTLLEELDMALVQLNKDNIFFEQRLYQKYFGNTVLAAPTLTKEDKLLLAKKENGFTVLISADHQPVQYVDDNGDPCGIIIDIMDMIALDAGIEFHYVYETETTMIDYAEVDLSIALLNSPFTELPHTKTDIYLESPMMLVGKKTENADNLGRVGMLDYRNFTLDAAEIIRYGSYEEMIALMRANEIDYIASSDIATTYILDELGTAHYSAYAAGSSILNRILVSNELLEYVDIFDKLIARLDQKKIETIVVEHRSHFSPEDSILDYLAKNPIFFMGLAIVVGCIAALIFITMDRNKKKALYEIINKDKLTGLMSPYQFDEMASSILKTAKPKEYTLVSLDIDNFQYINEAYGFKMGSKVLVALAQHILAQYGNDCLITRVIADKFLILTPTREDCHIPCGQKTCDDCISNVIQDVLDTGCRTSTSRGVYEIHNPLEQLSYMIDCANSARTLGKHIYGNTSYQFTDDMLKKRGVVNKIVSTMEQSLQNREFTVFYQPKVDLKECNLMGAEALVRWIPSNGTMIYPDEFIPLFEKNGFIIELDHYVFEEVCRFIAQWKDTLNLPIISVNLSVITLLNTDLAEQLAHIASKYSICNDLLELEITESAVVKDFDQAMIQIKRLKEKGFSISLDDFGSGLSSLNRLKDINVDVLKIDREFLAANLTTDKGITIIKNIIRMAKEIHIASIAEGVETREHVDFLQKLECDYAQGYYFARPMKEKDFLDIVANGIQKK